MAKSREVRNLPEPGRIIDRAAEAAGDAGDLGAELLSTGVDAATEIFDRLTSTPEEPMKAPRRHATKATGSAGAPGRTHATVKRAAESAEKAEKEKGKA